MKITCRDASVLSDANATAGLFAFTRRPGGHPDGITIGHEAAYTFRCLNRSETERRGDLSVSDRLKLTNRPVSELICWHHLRCLPNERKALAGVKIA